MIKNRVQILNPRTNRWTKIDTKTGFIISHKKDKLKYKGIQIL